MEQINQQSLFMNEYTINPVYLNCMNEMIFPTSCSLLHAPNPSIMISLKNELDNIVDEIAMKIVKIKYEQKQKFEEQLNQIITFKEAATLYTQLEDKKNSNETPRKILEASNEAKNLAVRIAELLSFEFSDMRDLKQIAFLLGIDRISRLAARVSLKPYPNEQSWDEKLEDLKKTREQYPENPSSESAAIRDFLSQIDREIEKLSFYES